MKNYFTIYSFLLVVFSLGFLSCDKDSDVVTSFPFQLTSELPENITINHPQEVSFKISPDRVVNSNRYQFKYEVLNGNGAYLDSDGNPLPENEFFELSSLTPKFDFLSPNTGSVKVSVLVKDSGGENDQIELTYEVVHNPFSLELSSPSLVAKVNEPKSVSLALFNTGPDDSATFQRAFYMIQGSADLYDETGESLIPLESFEPIQEGTHPFKLRFEESGTASFVAVTKDGNQQVKSDTLVFQVDGIDLDFTATTEVNNVFLDQSFNIVLAISEDQGSGDSYHLRYAISKGEANILNENDESLNAGILYPVETGSFIWKGVANAVGPLTISFVLKNQNGNEISREIVLNVIDAGLVFNPVPTSSEAFLQQAVSFNASATESPNTSPPYELVFETSDAGFLTYGGQTYNPGETIQVASVPFSFDYTGTTIGSHQLTFTFSNSFGSFDVVDKDISFLQPDYTVISTPGQNSTTLNNPLVVLHTITTSAANHTFQMRYVVNSGDVSILTQNNQNAVPGQLYNVPDGDFNWSITPSSTEDIDVSFTTIDNYGKEKVTNIQATVISPDYSVLSTPGQNSTTLNTPLIVLNTITTSEANHTFQMRYVVNSGDVSVMTQNNQNAVPGQLYDVPDGNFNWSITPSSTEDIDVSFTTIDNYGKEKVTNIQATVISPDYSVLSTPGQNSTTLNTPLIVLNTITTSEANHTFQMRYVVNSGDVSVMTQNNQNAVPGQLYDVPDGDFNWSITPSSTEDIDVSFTTIDNYGKEKVTNIQASVINPEFDFTLQYQNAVQTSDDLSILLDLTGSDQLNYTVAYNISPQDGSVLRYNNNVLQQNAPISIGALLLDFDFVGAKNYDVEFIVTSNLATQKVHSAAFSVNHTPFSFSVTNPSNVLVDAPVPLTLSLNGSNKLTYSVTRNILSGNGTFNFANNTVISQGNNAFSYMPNGLGLHQLQFTATDDYGYSKTVNRNVSVANPPPVINSVSGKLYQKFGCFTNIYELCSLNFRFTLNYTSQTDLTDYRIRLNNVVGPEIAFPNTNTITLSSGSVKIYDDDSIDDNNVTYKINTVFDIQVKDSDGQWSSWYQIQTPNAYGLYFQ